MGSTVRPFALVLQLRLAKLVNEVPKLIDEINSYHVPRSTELVPLLNPTHHKIGGLVT